MSSVISDIQSANSMTVSVESLACVFGLIYWKILVVWEDIAASLVIFSWPSGGTPKLSKGKRVVGCGIENFDPMVAVTNQRAVLFTCGRKL